MNDFLKNIAAAAGGVFSGEDNRVRRIAIDSRRVDDPSGTLFVALRGARRDGHDYIAELYDRGVRAFLVDRELSGTDYPGAGFVRCDDSLEGLQRWAARYRQTLRCTVVGITGSNGKTVLKEWIAQLCPPQTKLFRSPKSYNSQIGVPLSLLMIEPEDRIAVIEAGISSPGEMRLLERMIRPDVGLITNVGDAHQENFPSVEAKIAEKLDLFEHASAIVCNACDEAVCEAVRARYADRRIVGSSPESCDLSALPFSDAASRENAAEALALEPSIVEAFRKLQKLHDEWRETGPVANEFKETLWERFKEASSRVNKQHQAFFENIKAEQLKNLELKTSLCEQTEELAQQLCTTRKEWNRANDRLLEIQKVWKTVGFAPKKDNTRIYERFRTACDRFFERKSAHFSAIDSQYEENLAKKRQLLEELRNFAVEEREQGFEALKELQRRWSETGFVPIKQKEAVQNEYRKLVDDIFARLRGSERERHMERFRGKISSMASEGGNDRRMRHERERLYNKLKQLEADVALLENNIGFFAKSKNAEAMIRDVNEKIARSREEMATLVEKINLIDKQGE